MEKSSEVVQFMQFDCEGNLFVFEPGCGCSGVPRKVSQGSTQQEMLSVFDDKNDSKSKEIVKLGQENVYKLKPSAGASAMINTSSRRLANFILSLVGMSCFDLSLFAMVSFNVQFYQNFLLFLVALVHIIFHWMKLH